MNIMSSNKTIFALILLVPFATVNSNMATSIDNDSIVTVSGQKVMSESTTGKEMQEKLQREHKKIAEPLEKAQIEVQTAESNLKKLQDTLQTEFTKFDNEAKTMSESAREKKQIELQDKALDFETKKRTFERDAAKLQADARKIEAKMSELYQTEMMKLDKLVKETISEEAKKRGWKVALMEESVMYADSSISRTEIIIQALDAKTKAMKLAKKEALEKKSENNAKK